MIGVHPFVKSLQNKEWDPTLECNQLHALLLNSRFVEARLWIDTNPGKLVWTRESFTFLNQTFGRCVYDAVCDFASIFHFHPDATEVIETERHLIRALEKTGQDCKRIKKMHIRIVGGMYKETYWNNIFSPPFGWPMHPYVQHLLERREKNIKEGVKFPYREDERVLYLLLDFDFAHATALIQTNSAMLFEPCGGPMAWYGIHGTMGYSVVMDLVRARWLQPTDERVKTLQRLIFSFMDDDWKELKQSYIELANQAAADSWKDLLVTADKPFVASRSDCVVCFEVRSNAFWSPCGHNTFCFGCIEHLTLCPLCRTKGCAEHLSD
jgi:hypothetical protein